MLILATVLYAIWLAIGLGLRSAVQRRQTGDTGVRGFGAERGTGPWWASLLLALSHSGGIAGPIAGLIGLPALGVLDHPGVRIAGFALVGAGLAGSVWAQLAMGESWRIGVGQGELSPLVTAGPFAGVRNPIFTAVVVTAGGFALVAGNVVSVVVFAALVVAVELQVRVIEEPHLQRMHGPRYREYAGSTGRFVPGIGRLARGGAPGVSAA